MSHQTQEVGDSLDDHWPIESFNLLSYTKQHPIFKYLHIDGQVDTCTYR